MAFFIPPQNQTHTIYMQGLFPCPASPTRPPDVQISLGPASASLQRRATWEWLSWQGAAGPLACQSKQSGALCEGSLTERPAQWKCQQEPEISLCDWWAFYCSLLKRCVTWRRPASLCYGHAQVCAHAVQVYASILTSIYRYRCVFLVFWLPI